MSSKSKYVHKLASLEAVEKLSIQEVSLDVVQLTEKVGCYLGKHEE